MDISLKMKWDKENKVADIITDITVPVYFCSRLTKIPRKKSSSNIEPKMDHKLNRINVK